MTRAYLLGFVQNCREAPVIEGFAPRLTLLDKYGVLWIRSPEELYANKKDFLALMLRWLEHIYALRVTMLPVQLGISTSEEMLLEILRMYKNELAQSLVNIEGSWEYDLKIKLPGLKQDFPGSARLTATLHNGKEYLALMKSRYTEKICSLNELQTLVALITAKLAGRVKDYTSELSPNIREAELAFLVPDILIDSFIRDLQLLNKESLGILSWTGPWPPFHFSSFKLRAGENLLSGCLRW